MKDYDVNRTDYKRRDATARERQDYYILSGEGEVGAWERVVTTERGIRLRLGRERRGGGRWAHAVRLVAVEASSGDGIGEDVETGCTRFVPSEVVKRLSKETE